MKTNQKQVRGFLIILLVAQAVNATLFISLEKAQASLGQYIYSQTAEPFLGQALTTPQDLNKGLTINKLMK